MKQEEFPILDKLGKEPGFKVPEGYFEAFNERMEAMLPEVEITDVSLRPSLWVRIRPYVYMAAMFAGIWCMMQVFNTLSGANKMELTASEVATEMMVNEQVAEEFMLQGSVSDAALLMSCYEDSVFQE